MMGRYPPPRSPRAVARLQWRPAVLHGPPGVHFRPGRANTGQWQGGTALDDRQSERIRRDAPSMPQNHTKNSSALTNNSQTVG